MSDEKVYAFTGRVVRLTQEDYDRWKAAFHTILDLNSELIALDAWLDEEKPKNWFATASALLNKRHQTRLAQRVSFDYGAESDTTVATLLKKHGIPPLGPAGY